MRAPRDVWVAWSAICSTLAACTPAFHNEQPDGAAGAGAGGSGRRSVSGADGGAAGAATGGATERYGGGTSGRASTAGNGGRGTDLGMHEHAGADGGAAAASGATQGSAGAGAASGSSTGGAGGSVGSSGMSALGGAAPAAGGGRTTVGGAPQAGHESAGVSGLGASAGAGGMPATTSFCVPSLVLDDLEDGDALTCNNQGRGGDWWTATGTTTGTIDPPTNEDFPAYPLGADARPGSNYGMRLAGTRFGHTDDDWASLGFFLAGESAYDLTPYTGITFYAKSRAAATMVHVKFATATTTPASEGGSCAADCNDHFAAVVALGSDWQKFTVTFAALEQEGWAPKPKDLAHSLFVYFGYLGTDAGAENFDFLVDDIRLY